jgi:hypothetical protein
VTSRLWSGLPLEPAVRLLLVTTILAGGLAAWTLALPTRALACSCAPPDLASPAFTGEEQAVFIGTAREPLADGSYRFVVERWFKGGSATTWEIKVASEREPMGDGGMAINTCGLHFEVGDRLIMAAGLADGTYRPGLCSPHAVMNSEEGARLLNAAVTAFGQGATPGQEPDPRDRLPDDPDLAGFAVATVGLLVLVVVVAVVASVRRRREEEPPRAS